MDYFVLINQQQIGPLTRQEVLEMLDAGRASVSDLAWSTGLDNWRPLSEVLERAPDVARPRESGTDQMHSNASSAGAPISWIPAFVFYAVASVFALITWMLPGGIIETVFLMTLPCAVAAIVFWAILHYQLWKAVPPQYAATTPGKAVGFLFIPFFNFYWAFISWPKLSDGFERLQYERWGTIRINTQPLAYASAIAFVLSIFLLIVGGGHPLFDLMFTAAHVVFFLFFYRPLAQVANSP